MEVLIDGTVNLEPTIREDRIALHVLASATGNESLREHLKPYRGKGRGPRYDYNSLDDQEEEYKNNSLKFFSNAQDKFEILGVVIRHKESEDAQDGQESRG